MCGRDLPCCFFWNDSGRCQQQELCLLLYSDVRFPVCGHGLPRCSDAEHSLSVESHSRCAASVLLVGKPFTHWWRTAAVAQCKLGRNAEAEHKNPDT